MSFLDRSNTIAGPGFNRWMVPPAALCIHLCIGQAYAFSVFNLPMTKLIGISKSAPGDWGIPELGWIFSIAIFALGFSAAIFGRWVEEGGPRRAMFTAALCWSIGFLIAAVGVYVHNIWLVYFGYGLVGGIGLGIGYISPVSTLIKWFPDRRGMATGMAIMGFGGGAMIGSPLANILMNDFKTPTSVGVWQTLVVMAVIYFIYMTCGAFGYRIPPAGWVPEGWTPPAADANARITSRNVHLKDAHKTPQFWLIWLVLCLNVSAGIGVLALASPMLQEIFGGKLIGQPALGFLQLDAGQKVQIATIAAGFAALLSLFNIVGRFFWASLSDKIGRRWTYFTFFGLGIALYALSPTFAHLGSTALFVLAMCIILSMYGGGFATVPAYLADTFGTQFVGAIHGRLLTAWSVAGIVGPTVVAFIRETQLKAGVAPAQVYDYTLYILCSFLIVGFICNALVRPVDQKWYMSDADVAALQQTAAGEAHVSGSYGIGLGGLDGRAALAWLAVGIPLLWGAWITLKSAAILLG